MSGYPSAPSARAFPFLSPLAPLSLRLPSPPLFFRPASRESGSWGRPVRARGTAGLYFGFRRPPGLQCPQQTKPKAKFLNSTAKGTPWLGEPALPLGSALVFPVTLLFKRPFLSRAPRAGDHPCALAALRASAFPLKRDPTGFGSSKKSSERASL